MHCGVLSAQKEPVFEFTRQCDINFGVAASAAFLGYEGIVQSETKKEVDTRIKPKSNTYFGYLVDAAARGNRMAILQHLIDNGYRQRYNNQTGYSTRAAVCEWGSLAVVRMLLQPYPTDEYDEADTIHEANACIRRAARGGQQDSLDFLLKSLVPQLFALIETPEEDQANRANVWYGKWQRIILSEAAEHGHAAMAAGALSEGADLNYRDPWKSHQTPLMLASKHGHTEIVGMLLAFGADPHGNRGCSLRGLPIWQAVINGHVDVARLLIHGGVDDGLLQGQAAPCWAVPAAWRGRLQIVKKLAHSDLDLGVFNGKAGVTGAFAAAKKGHLHVLQYFLDHGVESGLVIASGEKYKDPRVVAEVERFVRYAEGSSTQRAARQDNIGSLVLQSHSP